MLLKSISFHSTPTSIHSCFDGVMVVFVPEESNVAETIVTRRIPKVAKLCTATIRFQIDNKILSAKDVSETHNGYFLEELSNQLYFAKHSLTDVTIYSDLEVAFQSSTVDRGYIGYGNCSVVDRDLLLVPNVSLNFSEVYSWKNKLLSFQTPKLLLSLASHPSKTLYSCIVAAYGFTPLGFLQKQSSGSFLPYQGVFNLYHEIHHHSFALRGSRLIATGQLDSEIFQTILKFPEMSPVYQNRITVETSLSLQHYPLACNYAVLGERIILFGTSDGKVVHVDCETGEVLFEWTAHNTAIVSLTVDLANNVLITASLDKNIRFWSLEKDWIDSPPSASIETDREYFELGQLCNSLEEWPYLEEYIDIHPL